MNPTEVIPGVEYQIALVPGQTAIVGNIWRIRYSTEASLRNKAEWVCRSKKLPEIVTHFLPINGIEVRRGTIRVRAWDLPTLLLTDGSYVELVGGGWADNMCPANQRVVGGVVVVML